MTLDVSNVCILPSFVSSFASGFFLSKDPMALIAGRFGRCEVALLLGKLGCLVLLYFTYVFCFLKALLSKRPFWVFFSFVGRLAAEGCWPWF